METKKIFDYQVDDNMALFVLIKGADVRIAKNGKKFIAFTFADRSGEISAKFWDASEQDIELFEAGKVVFLQGKRETYQQNPQIKIYKLRLATEMEPADPSLYLQSAPESTQDMEKELDEVIFEITNPNWNRIVRYLLKKYHAQFFSFPAAKKNHHDFAGGLAFHTLSILHLAQSVVKEYPGLNAPLLYSGVILHDLGKSLELSGPVATVYTVPGNLLGHIVLVDEEITEACDKLGIDKMSQDAILLRHMIVSHHGLLEYGSPVRPHLLEAEILHHLDDLDASIMMMNKALDHTAPGEYTERIFGMDGRNFYRPTEDGSLAKPE
ncbi:3'-5' exonuclease [Ligilactobacillus salitolerans]|uniref:3'-5' exonuclease n=1 Tax=Ligilactobacillus salitolerans TaxID=1808352 RepID=A0A401ISI8_9LACO|nr:OB-fold nucleic acid binding domain-containing protein [Ligilactobacillus salitolerans]GBG94486.1 3'-5' exonuclease [Ligilactobacillus salitolerans]